MIDKEAVQAEIEQLQATLDEWDSEAREFKVAGDDRNALRHQMWHLQRVLLRQKHIEDFRKYLDFLEIHDWLPLPSLSNPRSYIDSYDSITMDSRSEEDIKREARNITHLFVRATGKVEKNYDSYSMELKASTGFGTVKPIFVVPRDAV